MRGASLTSAALLLANVVRALSQWVLVVLTAQLGGAEVVGRYSLALAIAAPVFIVFDLSMRNVYVTLHRTIPFRTYLLVRLAFGSLAVVTLALVGALGAVDAALLVIIGLLRFTDAVLDLCYGSLQKGGFNLAIARSSLINSSVSILLSAVLYISTRDLVIALAGSLAGSLATTAFVFARVTGSAHDSVRHETGTLWKEVGLIARAGIPSGLAFASVSLLTYTPIYLLGIARDDEQIGLFAVLAYFPVLANLVFGSIQQATLHDYVRARYEGGDPQLRRLALRRAAVLLILGFASSLATIALGVPVLRLIYGPEFTVTFAEILPIGISLLFLPVIFAAAPVLLSKNLYGLQLGVGIASLAVCVALGLSTLSDFTLVTAGWVVVAGSASRAILGSIAATYSLRSSR